MEPSRRMIPLAVAVAAVLIFAAPETRGSAAAEDDLAAAAAADMVPALELSFVPVAGGGGGGVGRMQAGKPMCLQCRCCSKSSPGSCQQMSCCSVFDCDGAGNCHVVQQKCGCAGCGGAN
ncbi:hypothetical protein ACP4OV_007001 [Aristida adscensionis]